MALSNPVVGTFAAIGQSGDAVGKDGQAILTGTFVATVVLEVRDRAGNWAPVDSFTVPVAIKHEMAEGVGWRLNCTAHTSGTVVYELIATEPVAR